MTITTLQINHQTAPIGFDLSNLRVDFSVDAASFDHPTKALAVWTNDQAHPFYQVGPVAFDNNYFDLSDLALTPRTRYHVAVTVVNGNEETSATTFFETGKMDEAFQANWIANDNKDLQNTLFKREFNLGQEVSTARLYITGLGLYEASLNGDKIGNEYLTPGVTAYDQLVQVQTYDVTDQLRQGDNKLLVSTADGWYKGNYGFDGGQDKLYGDQHRIIAELHVTLADGTTLQINTDNQWETTQGPVTKSAIYYGEDYDDQFEITGWQPVTVLNSTKNVLKDRLSLPLTVQETITPTEIITTPAGETVIDFGQNQAGWPEFYCDEPAGTKITLQASEILQEGNFYRGNLRDARAAFTYVSDGKAKWVRPHFTYYGYRYMKIIGNTKPVAIKNFRAAVIYSQMETTGDIETTNPLVNRLFQNIQWGQKSNFFDVPTDCPQRDERLGWTGDANIFSNTAALNMNVFAFFKKYARDMAIEQNDHGGMLTMYAPKMNSDDGGAAVWGDAATFIPWNMYQDYGDPAILHQNYPEMKAWVDWITSQTTTPNLWTDGFQFGDWIALDGENPALPTGKTNEDYIASVYYYASSLIVSQTAALLGHDDDAKQYGEQAANIKQAIQREYITATGRVAIDTQTAYALALYFNLVSDDLKPRVTADLVARLGKDDDHLKTGFVGTPFINQVLSANGYHKLATKIFLQEDYPSWLYAVKMGATTVWERWNSVLEDGSMNPAGMNSLNHYSIGAVMEWAYKYVLGINEHTPGYQEFTFAPQFDYRLKKVHGHFQSSYGDIKVAYQIETDQDHTIQLSLTVPFGSTAHVKLPRSNQAVVLVNGQSVQGGSFDLTVGTYQISYVPDQDYIERYTADTPIKVLMQDKELINQIDTIDPVLTPFKHSQEMVNGGLGNMSIRKVTQIIPNINISEEHLHQVEELLTSTPLQSER